MPQPVPLSQTSTGAELESQAVEKTAAEESAPNRAEIQSKPREIGGPQGPEPTRYGDWEKRGRCIDF